MFHLLIDLRSDTAGATAVEYGLILALIFLAMLTALTEFGTAFEVMWLDISTRITTAITI